MVWFIFYVTYFHELRDLGLGFCSDTLRVIAPCVVVKWILVPCSVCHTPPCSILWNREIVMIEPLRKHAHYIFLIFAQNIDCGYTLEPHH